MVASIASEHGAIGAVYLTREQIATRISELGEEIARDYAGLDPILVAPLKSSVVFLADLTRVFPFPTHSTSSSSPLTPGPMTVASDC